MSLKRLIGSLGITAAVFGATASAQPAMDFAAAIDPTHSARAERRFLGQSVDRPLAENSDADVQQALRDLRRKAAKQGKVRVIVRVRAAFAPEGYLSNDDVRTQQIEIANAQERVHARLTKQRPDKVTRFEFVPFMAMEVDPDELDTLAAMPDVTDIQEDRPSRPLLSESAPLMHADHAWVAGYTGNGWSVAVLDTGVDKSHPFLAGTVISEACYSTTDVYYGSNSVCPSGVAQSTAVGSGVPCSSTIDSCYHGTHVAGIAAGLGNSFSGIAKGAYVIAMQVFSRFNDVASCGSNAPCALTWPSDQIKALQRVYTLRTTYSIAAVNMSLGGGRYYSQSACDTANDSITH